MLNGDPHHHASERHMDTARRSGPQLIERRQQIDARPPRSASGKFSREPPTGTVRIVTSETRAMDQKGAGLPSAGSEHPMAVTTLRQRWTSWWRRRAVAGSEPVPPEVARLTAEVERLRAEITELKSELLLTRAQRNAEAARADALLAGLGSSRLSWTRRRDVAAAVSMVGLSTAQPNPGPSSKRLAGWRGRIRRA